MWKCIPFFALLMVTTPPPFSITVITIIENRGRAMTAGLVNQLALTTIAVACFTNKLVNILKRMLTSMLTSNFRCEDRAQR